MCTRGGDKIVVDFLGKECIPNVGLLCYPVITAGEKAHRGSFINLTGVEDIEVHKRHSVEDYVSEKTPPIFMFHSANDGTVPVENSLIMAMKLAEYKIPFEHHVYRSASHGISTATKLVNTPNEYVSDWINKAIQFLKDVGVSL